MTAEELKTKVFGNTETGQRYTFRQWLIYVWFAVSLCLLGMVEDAPLWLLALLLGNFAASAYHLNKLPLPEDPEKDQYDDEE